MRLFSYVVALDYGFAPNPFHGWCTLATCKPRIRSVAQTGDWVLGTSSISGGRDATLVFLMQVAECFTFDEYWNDSRFALKRPNLHGSKKQAFGDNIYHRTGAQWHQENSHHSLANGSVNPKNLSRDTGVDRVLVGNNFVYWGGVGPEVPARFRDFEGLDICAGRGHRSVFPQDFIAAFDKWARALPERGLIGWPQDWRRSA